MLSRSWRSPELAWVEVMGAFGPSDGSGGRLSNVPGALAVLRDAHLFREAPEEVSEALDVLELHLRSDGQLYPAAVAALPFLVELVERRTLHAADVAELIAGYAALAPTLPAELRAAFDAGLREHEAAVLAWLPRHELAVAALAVHAPWLRPRYLAALAAASAGGLSAIALLALLELGERGAVVPRAPALAVAALAADDDELRMAAAAYLAGAEVPTDLASEVVAALPPHADAALVNLVAELWRPVVRRPRVAPLMRAATVLFVGPRLVLVRVDDRTVTLPWADAPVARGDVLQVGVTVHYQPMVAILGGPEGVRVISFAAAGAP